MVASTQFSAILQAEQMLNRYSSGPLFGTWREAFTAVETSYSSFVRMVRVPWFRRSRRPIPTFAEYLRSPEASDGLVGLVTYLATLPMKRCLFVKLNRIALCSNLRSFASQVAKLDRLSMAILAPTYQTFADSVRNTANTLKTQYPGAVIDYRALTALAALVDRGQGFALDEPDWSSQRSVEVYIDPDNVAHQLVGQLDRLETFFDTSVSQPGGNAQQTVQSARELMENGLLGLLKSYWGIERMSIKGGDLYNSESMVCDGVIETRSPERQPSNHVAKVLTPGFTYNNGRVFRLAHVFLYGEQ